MKSVTFGGITVHLFWNRMTEIVENAHKNKHIETVWNKNVCNRYKKMKYSQIICKKCSLIFGSMV